MNWIVRAWKRNIPLCQLPANFAGIQEDCTLCPRPCPDERDKWIEWVVDIQSFVMNAPKDLDRARERARFILENGLEEVYLDNVVNG